MKSVQQIEALLPQTQCGQCGYAGCAPYAEALFKQESAINLCPPGGRKTIAALANLLHVPVLEPADLLKTEAPKVLAVIDEDVCIGCTACIKACPVDAIVGATKRMHDVIALECTGCGLCVPPCPVDCIDLLTVEDEFLPRVLEHTQVSAYEAATHAKQRFERRSLRLERLETRKQQEREAKRTALQAATTAHYCTDGLDKLQHTKQYQCGFPAILMTNEHLLQQDKQVTIQRAKMHHMFFSNWHVIEYCPV